jgi:N4-(beta-N-acetylglucosaminyl)-L-asparaginase
MAPHLQALELLLGLLALTTTTTTPLLAGAADVGTDDNDGNNSPGLPFVINTWGGPFTVATDAAYLALVANGDGATAALDAVQTGCSTCEANKCDGSVGYGGSPDEACETTLDALLMDGTTLNTGAVASLRRIKNAVGVARAVLDHTAHSLLAGDLATAFAVQNGFVEEDLATNDSLAACADWRAAACQPNYRVDVAPNASLACGPYVPLGAYASSSTSAASSAAATGASTRKRSGQPDAVAYVGHDTISQIAITSSGVMAAGTSTNGASHKVPGRVGDGPIAGSGSYADGEVGGCGATGDGDIMMRFLPCYQAVESLRRGLSPRAAAEDAVRRMVRRYPAVSSGIVVVDRWGNHGGAGSGWNFTYAFRGGSMNETTVVTVLPLEVAVDEQEDKKRGQEEPRLRYREQMLL